MFVKKVKMLSELQINKIEMQDIKRQLQYGNFTFVSYIFKTFEPVHEISNNVVCATSKAPDQPAHTRSLIRAFASLLSIL